MSKTEAGRAWFRVLENVAQRFIGRKQFFRAKDLLQRHNLQSRLNALSGVSLVYNLGEPGRLSHRQTSGYALLVGCHLIQ